MDVIEVEGFFGMTDTLTWLAGTPGGQIWIENCAGLDAWIGAHSVWLLVVGFMISFIVGYCWATPLPNPDAIWDPPEPVLPKPPVTTEVSYALSSASKKKHRAAKPKARKAIKRTRKNKQ